MVIKTAPKKRVRPKPKPKPKEKPVATEKPSDKSVEDLISDIKKATPAPAAPKVAENKNEPSRDEMLAHLARQYNTTPEEVYALLRVPESVPIGVSPNLEPKKPAGPLNTPVILKRDYWGPSWLKEHWSLPPSLENPVGDNRIRAGTVLKLDRAEAQRLIELGVAERRDPLPDN